MLEPRAGGGKKERTNVAILAQVSATLLLRGSVLGQGLCRGWGSSLFLPEVDTWRGAPTTWEEPNCKKGTWIRQSDTTASGREEGVCLACIWGVKQKHTYGGQCANYVPGAMLEQMKRAAKGGLRDKHRLLMTLRLQGQDAQQQETITSSSTSSTSSSTSRKRKQAKGQQEKPQETAIVGKRIGENNAPPLPGTGEAIVEEEDSLDMIEQILRWGEGQNGGKSSRKKPLVRKKEEEKPAKKGASQEGGKGMQENLPTEKKEKPEYHHLKVQEWMNPRSTKEKEGSSGWWSHPNEQEWTRISCAKNQQSSEHGKSDVQNEVTTCGAEKPRPRQYE